MARTALTRTVLANRSARTGTIATANTPDTANGNYFTPTGAEEILIRNTTASPGTVTITPVADQYGAVGSGAPSIIAVPASSWVSTGLIRPQGFTQSDGRVYVDASATTLKLYVLSYPQR